MNIDRTQQQWIAQLESEFVSRWLERFGTSLVTAKDLVPLAGDLVAIADSDRGRSSALGQRVSRMRGRAFRGHEVVFAGRRYKTSIYRLQPLEGTVA